MARRRMVSLDIVDADNFAVMSLSARYLYYELIIRADDDGFLGAPMRIIGMVGCTKTDLNELVNNGYVIEFETGVIVIRDWKVHNNVRKDMYKETLYQSEFGLLHECKNRYYLKTECNVTENVTQNVTENVTQDRIGKGSIGEDRLESTVCPEPEQPSPDPSGILLPLVDGTDYDVPLSKIEKWATAYPAVDVRQQLQRMIAWLDANPKRRKTKKGIDRFINTWLSREQDRGGTFRNGISQQSESTPQGRDLQAEYDEMYDKYLSNREPSPDDPFQ